MSEQVSILEGQTSAHFSGVKFLRISLQGGGYCDYVPESERELTDGDFDKNGTYYASNEKDNDGKPYYAYEEVKVNVTKSGKVTGKGADGNTHEIGVDDDGNLTDTTLPDEIRIETKPTKLTYAKGENISLAGIVVKAYTADGILWQNEGYTGGVIPINELEYKPKKATEKGEEYGKATSDLPMGGDMNLPFEFSTSRVVAKKRDGEDAYFTLVGDGAITAKIYDGNKVHVVVGAKSEGTYIKENGLEAYHTANINGKTVYYNSVIASQLFNGYVEVSPNYYPENNQIAGYTEHIAWTMIYGDITEGGFPVEIAWSRPEDGEELKAKFYIRVTDDGTDDGGNDENNPGAGGGGGGSW